MDMNLGDTVIWMRMVLMGSCIGMLGPQLVKLLEKD